MTPRQELIFRRRETKRLRKHNPHFDVAAEVERRLRAAAELTPAVLKEILNG